MTTRSPGFGPLRLNAARVLALGLLLACATTPLLHGQPTPTIDDSITVSANRDPVPIEQSGSSVSVIGDAEIEQRNPLNIADLLRTVAGVELTQTGGPGQVSSLRVRGGTAQQALVLLDGVRINTAANGDVDFAHLAATGIERVEVLRGPQAVYGSEAMSGVISLTTRRADQPLSAHLSAEAGSREHQRLAAGLSGANDGEGTAFDWSLSGSDLETDAVSQLAPRLGGLESDPYENRTLLGGAGLSWDDAAVRLRAHDSEGDSSLDGFGVDDVNARATTDTRALSLAAEFAPVKRWRQTLRVSESRTDILGRDPDTFFNNYTIESETTAFGAQADLDLVPGHTLNLGGSREDRSALNEGSFDEEATLDALYGQWQWSLGSAFNATLGTRYDDHSVFGSQDSLRGTLSAELPGGNTRVRASFGSAFRAPNFNELYFPFAGDPTLSPETSEGWDVGLVQRWGNAFSVDLGYFDLDFEDLIAFDLSTFTFGNIAEASSRGVEATARWRPSAGNEIRLAHTYNKTEDLASGEPLARRPRNRTSLVALFAPGEKLGFALSAFRVSDRVDSNGSDMDDYTRVDLSAQATLRPWLTPYVRVENLFDEDYEEVPGFTTPGATVMVGVTVRR